MRFRLPFFYSEGHRQQFGFKNDIFNVERNPIDFFPMIGIFVWLFRLDMAKDIYL